MKLWTKAIKNHLYWCATSTKKGFDALIQQALRPSTVHELFSDCTHGDLEPREWILPGNSYLKYSIGIGKSERY